jgi:hypothetical protein
MVCRRCVPYKIRLHCKRYSTCSTLVRFFTSMNPDMMNQFSLSSECLPTRITLVRLIVKGWTRLCRSDTLHLTLHLSFISIKVVQTLFAVGDCCYAIFSLGTFGQGYADLINHIYRHPGSFICIRRFQTL